MKHTDWLHLKKEGENICSILRQQDYQCRKQTRCLTWKISKEGTSYVLTWLPAPVSDWNVIPKDSNPVRKQLVRVVQSTLKTLRLGEVITYQLIPQPEDFSRPWAIVRLLPNAQCYTVGRFYNRADAQDHLKVLNHFMPAAEFEVIFDVPTDRESKEDECLTLSAINDGDSSI